jgi:hypothetical protein
MVSPHAWCEFWDEKYTLLEQCFSQQSWKREHAIAYYKWKPSRSELIERFHLGIICKTQVRDGRQFLKKSQRIIRGTWDRFSEPSINPSDFMRSPPDAAYSVCTIEGKGRGIVANREISYGEVISKEAPLLVMPYGGARACAEHWLGTLPRKALESILLLHNEKLEFKELRENTFYPDRPLKKFFKGILESNMVGAEDECGDIWMLLLQGSLFNHSDRPNVIRWWDSAEEKMSFYACEDIKIGEELVVDYAPYGWGEERPGWFKDE